MFGKGRFSLLLRPSYTARVEPRWSFEESRRRRKSVKRWVKVLLVIAGLIVLAIVSIRLFVHANTFRPAIEKQLSATLGRNVKLGDLSLSVFSGSLVGEDLIISDDPNFSAKPFLTAKEIRIGVSMKPLIFARELHL